MGLSRIIHADQAGFLGYLEEQVAEWEEASGNERLTLAKRNEYAAKAQGLAWAVRAVRDWEPKPDGWTPDGAAPGA
jgi:hypothetical protein